MKYSLSFHQLRLREYSIMRRAQTAQSDFLPNKAIFRRRDVARKGKPTQFSGKSASWMGADYFGIGAK